MKAAKEAREIKEKMVVIKKMMVLLCQQRWIRLLIRCNSMPRKAKKGDSSSGMGANAWILLVILTLTTIVTRVLFVIWRSIKPLRNTPPQHLSTLIVLGSGGHTAEMLNLLSVLQRERFTPRFYIAATTDNMSLQKARSFEDSFVDKLTIHKWNEAEMGAGFLLMAKQYLRPRHDYTSQSGRKEFVLRSRLQFVRVGIMSFNGEH